MKTEQYPTWLVPPDIAKELKGIGFNKACVYYTNEQLMVNSKPYTYDSIKTHIYIRNGALITDIGNHNIFKNRISVPVWDDVFDWFREKGYILSISEYLTETVSYFYHNELFLNSIRVVGKTYSQTRKDLALKIIENCKHYKI
ncbi:MAG: hypothetical protein ACFNVN_02050 [Capnocytophaga ochracea]